MSHNELCKLNNDLRAEVKRLSENCETALSEQDRLHKVAINTSDQLYAALKHLEEIRCEKLVAKGLPEYANLISKARVELGKNFKVHRIDHPFRWNDEEEK